MTGDGTDNRAIYIDPSIVGIIEEDLNKKYNSLDKKIRFLEGALQ